MTHNYTFKLLLATVLSSILMPGSIFASERKGFEGAGFEDLPPELKERIIGEAAGEDVKALREFGTISKDFNEAMKQALATKKAYIKASDLTPENVETLKRVGDLHLKVDQANDQTMALIGKLINLQGISLSNTKITDQGLAHLKELKNLEVIYLGGTRITDQGLAHLKELKNLQAIWLSGTNITDQGLAHLKESLPNIIVYR